MGCALFVPNKDMPQGRVLRENSVERKNCAAGDAKYNAHAFFEERFDDDLATGEVSDRAATLAAADAVAEFVQRLELPYRLRDVDVPQDALEDIARAAVGESPHKEAVIEILRKAW